MRRRQRKSFLVLGLGRFGASVARTLAALGYDVVGVDEELAVLDEVKDVLSDVVQLDATNTRALRDLGIPEFDACIVGKGEELGMSIGITMNLIELGARFVVAKAVTDQHARILERIGAHEVVFPERDMGARLAHTLVSPLISDFFELAPDVSIVEIEAPPSSHGHSLSELELRPRYGITVLGIRRNAEFLASPTAEMVIQPGDRLAILGEESRIEDYLGA